MMVVPLLSLQTKLDWVPSQHSHTHRHTQTHHTPDTPHTHTTPHTTHHTQMNTNAQPRLVSWFWGPRVLQARLLIGSQVLASNMAEVGTGHDDVHISVSKVRTERMVKWLAEMQLVQKQKRAVTAGRAMRVIAATQKEDREGIGLT